MLLYNRGEEMEIVNMKMLVSIDQLTNDVDSVFEVVNKYGKAIILGGNKPLYILMKYTEASDDDVIKRISPKYKLHEAMQIVLNDQPDKEMKASLLADEIYRRGLYIKKDGTKAMANQIRARSEKYSALFVVKADNIIKLKNQER